MTSTPQIYIIATPIGNLGDITLRALETLKTVDFILAEDTRVTARLLEHYGIKKPLISYDDYSNDQDIAKIITRLDQGETAAMVSDAGTPNISDPGKRLLQSLSGRIAMISPIPGPSALTALMSVCPFPQLHFTFVGFLPKEHEAKLNQLRYLLQQPATFVFYESPNRVIDTLGEIAQLAPKRRCLIGRELTKIHEQLILNTVEEVIAYLSENDKCRGEFAIAIEGSNERIFNDEELLQMLKIHLQKMSLKDAVAEVHLSTKQSKKKIYDLALQLKI